MTALYTPLGLTLLVVDLVTLANLGRVVLEVFR